MIKKICDRCGCDMTATAAILTTAAPFYPRYDIRKVNKSMLSITIDLCPKCQMLLNDFLQEEKDKIYDANKP